MPSCGTAILYGNVLMNNVQFRNFEQNIVPDESGADLLHSKFMISIESHVSNQGILDGVFTGTNADATTRLAALQSLIESPRQRFQLWFEDNLWIDVAGDGIEKMGVFDGRIDVDNGPKVRNVTVTHVAGNRAFRVTATFEICVILCQNPTSRSINTDHWLIHNRWDLEESIDDDFHWQRIIRGKARVAHASMWNAVTRYFLMPRLSPEYQFTGGTFVQSKDGLNLNYSMSMRQRHSAPPKPATSWKASQAEEVGIGGGSGASQLDIQLNGPPGGSKKQLLIAALAIIEARYGYQADSMLDKDGNSSFFVTSARVVDILHENSIHVSIGLQRAYDPEKKQTWLGLSMKMLEKWPESNEGLQGYLADYDKHRWPEPIPWSDDGPAGMFTKMFQSPCGFPPTARDAPINWDPLKQIEPPDIRPKQPRPDTLKLYRDNHDQGLPDSFTETYSSVNHENQRYLYTDAELESRYIIDHGRAAVPKFPVTTPGYYDTKPDTCKIIQFHQPIAKRVIWYRATRIGKQPSIPRVRESFNDGNEIAHWLDEDEVLAYPPELLPDGVNFSHKVEMRLVYLMSRNPVNGDKLELGTLPWDILKPADSVVKVGSLDDPEII